MDQRPKVDERPFTQTHDQTQRLRAALRESQRSMAMFLLSESKTAHAFLDLSLTLRHDVAWSERLIQSAFDSLKRIDGLILKLNVEGDLQDQILAARKELAERLREMGRRYPVEKG